MRVRLRPRRALALALLMAAVAAAVAAPASGTRAARRLPPAPPPSLFGINTGTFDSSYQRFLRDMPTAKRLGARWIHLTGANIKYRRGRLTFKQMDDQVNRARRLGLGVLMSLGGIKGACSMRPAPTDSTNCPPTSRRDLRVYGAYVRKLLRHFRGRVAYYESWVEPNHRSFWPSGPDPKAYVRLLETEYSAFRAADRSAKLIFGSPSDFGIGDNSHNGMAALIFGRQALDALGGRHAFDLAGLRPYRFPPDVGPNDTEDAGGAGWIHVAPGNHWRRMDWRGMLLAYERLFTDHGYGRPAMWFPEFGWSGQASGPHDSYHPTEQQQADNLSAAYRLLVGDPSLSFVQAAFWFNLRDYQPGLRNPDPEFFAHYGLLHHDFTTKPAGASFSYFAHGGR